LKVLDSRVYKPVGRCIYCCETEKLQKEHILPFGLSGTAVLPKASCARCARITGEQEQVVLRGPLWAVRVYRALRSRTKHREAPATYPLTLVRGGEEAVIRLPVGEYPILLHFPLFAPPAILEPSGYVSGIRVSCVVTVSIGPRPEEVAKRNGGSTIRLSQTLHPVSFARVIAKIAYAMAAAEGVLDRVEGVPLVLPAILGEVDDIGRWVGTITNPIKKFSGLLHRIEIHEDRDKELLIAEVHLFSDSESPSYGVILGKLAGSSEKAGHTPNAGQKNEGRGSRRYEGTR
jgi:hypothetical protein